MPKYYKVDYIDPAGFTSTETYTLPDGLPVNGQPRVDGSSLYVGNLKVFSLRSTHHGSIIANSAQQITQAEYNSIGAVSAPPAMSQSTIQDTNLQGVSGMDGQDLEALLVPEDLELHLLHLDHPFH